MGSLAPPLRSVRRAASPPALLALTIGLAAFVAVVWWIAMPLGDLLVVLAYLLVSTAGAGLVGFVVYRMSEARRRSLRTKVLLAHAFGAAIVIANIVVTSQLMFISSHDLGLLMLLMVF